MARVHLSFRATPAPTDRYGCPIAHIIRLRVGVQFLERSPDGFSETYRAIVDTGAPFGLLPRPVWEPLEVSIRRQDCPVVGVSQRKACETPASFGDVRARLVDERGNTTGVCCFPAYLAKTDRAPLLLGFAGVFSEFPVHFDYRRREAWAEVP